MGDDYWWEMGEIAVDVDHLYREDYTAQGLTACKVVAVAGF